MIDINEMCARILSILEEFSCDNICALMNTVQQRGDRASSQETGRKAVSKLVDSKLVTVQRRGSAYPSPADVLVSNASLSAGAAFEGANIDPTRGVWYGAKTGQMAELCLTDKGRNNATALLNVRGYRWWEQSN